MCLFIIQQHLEYNGVPDFDMYPIQWCPLTLRCGLHEMLQAMLQSQHLPTRLKVLTIANELLYDDSACQTLASKAAFLNVDLAEHDPEEEPNMALELAAANANILASEISRRLASVAVAVHGSCFSFKSIGSIAAAAAAASTSSGSSGLGGSAPTSWLASVARTPERQDAQLELLSWSRTRSAIRALELRVRSSTASAEDAIGVLDQTYRSFEHTTGSAWATTMLHHAQCTNCSKVLFACL